MLYHIKLQYGFHVEAANKSQAFAKACKHLRENPEALVSRVAQPDEPKGHPSLLKRLVTGRRFAKTSLDFG